jgi:hypothetical protein
MKPAAMEKWHRRQAIVLASQLPDNTADAVMVLQALKELVETFLMSADGTTDALAANALAFRGGHPAA